MFQTVANLHCTFGTLFTTVVLAFYTVIFSPCTIEHEILWFCFSLYGSTIQIFSLSSFKLPTNKV